MCEAPNLKETKVLLSYIDCIFFLLIIDRWYFSRLLQPSTLAERAALIFYAKLHNLKLNEEIEMTYGPNVPAMICR